MSYKPLLLNEKREWLGEWWLSDAPERRVPGILKYDGEGGIRLKLIGALEGGELWIPKDETTLSSKKAWKIIYGVAQNCEISLLNPVPLSVQCTVGGRAKSPIIQTVLIESALIGVHIGKEDEKIFNAAEVSFEDLCAWVASDLPEEYSVDFSGCDYRLSKHIMSDKTDVRKGGNVYSSYEKAFIKIIPEKTFSLDDALEQVKKLHSLFAIATHSSAGVISVSLELPVDELASSSSRPVFPRVVNVLYLPVVIGNCNSKGLRDYQLLFNDTIVSFEEVIPRWLGMYDQLRSVINAILSIRFTSGNFVENDILIAVSAAEALSKALSVAKGDSKSGGKPPLKERLLGLTDCLDEKVVSKLVPNGDYWCKETAKVRNALAHGDKASEEVLRKTLIELDAIARVTTMVVIFNLLKELGVPVEHQLKIIDQHPEVKKTSWLARKYLEESQSDSGELDATTNS